MRAAKLTALALVVVALATTSAHAAGPPQVLSTWVTDVGASTAVLHAEINPNGSPTSYSFQYLTAGEFEENLKAGRDPFFGARAAPLVNNGIGSGTVTRSVALTLAAPANPLAAATPYRYRVVATNGFGPTPGPLRSLRTTTTTPPAGLPDDRAWELVSPPGKNGGAVAAPGSLSGGAEIQAAAGGGAITYSSAAAFAEPLGAPPASQYLSRRGQSGWLTENLSAPLDSGVYGDHPDGAPYRLFSEDLQEALLAGGEPCRGLSACPEPAAPLSGSGGPEGFATYYLRSSQGFASLLRPTDFTYTALSPAHLDLSFAGANPDLSTILLASCAALTAQATEVDQGSDCDPSKPNLYRWSAGGLQLVNLLAGVAPPYGRLASPLGAVSEDGARVYWQEVASDSIWIREAGQESRFLPDSEGAAFQSASADGSLAYFTRAGQLYRFSLASESSTPIADGVLGVLGVARDGARVYYQDATGLWAWHLGEGATQIAAGADAASPSNFPAATGTARLSSDGTVLAFLSDSSTIGFDNTDALTGLPDTEAYLYDAKSGQLRCASCNLTGERPRGSASLPGALQNGSTLAYRPRALSEDGRRLIFSSTDRLLGADANSLADVYQWEAPGKGDCSEAEGCQRLISDAGGSAATFLDASADGSDAFFLTSDSLVPSDPGSADVYDARVGGGLSDPQQPIPCNGDSCQPLPSPPEDPTAGTTLPNSGNPPPKYFKEHQKRHHHRKHRRHHHRRRVARPGPSR